MTMHLASLGAGKSATHPTTLVHDLFNTATNGTVLSSETPAVGPEPTNSVQGSELTIQSGTASTTGYGTDCYAALSSANVSMSSSVSIAGDCDIAFILRLQDASNYWALSYDPTPSTAVLTLWEITTSSNISRQSCNSSGNIKSGSSLVFQAQTNGQAISGNWDQGDASLSYSSSDFQTNKTFGIALGLLAGSSGGNTDNFGPLTITNP